jgi:hypothetical protein
MPQRGIECACTRVSMRYPIRTEASPLPVPSQSAGNKLPINLPKCKGHIGRALPSCSAYGPGISPHRAASVLRYSGELAFNLSEYMVVLDKPLGLTLAPDPVTGQVGQVGVLHESLARKFLHHACCHAEADASQAKQESSHRARRMQHALCTVTPPWQSLGTAPLRSPYRTLSQTPLNAPLHLSLLPYTARSSCRA